jgi:mRNA-degrading endonuclease YafQ of YafQ-DinJ toxin-antitoxin module
MELYYSNRFKRRYKKLDQRTKKVVKDTLDLLLEDFTHPSLRNKKVRGRESIREISGTMDIRITFRIEKPDMIILRNCGHHDDVLNNP